MAPPLDNPSSATVVLEFLSLVWVRNTADLHIISVLFSVNIIGNICIQQIWIPVVYHKHECTADFYIGSIPNYNGSFTLPDIDLSMDWDSDSCPVEK